MFELIWALLGITILIYFIIICIQVIKIIRVNLGTFPSIIFILGLLSLFGKANEINAKDNIFYFQETPTIIFKGSTYLREKKIEDNLMNNINLIVLFGENKNEKKVLQASANRDGFACNTYWKTMDISVSKLQNNTYQYYVMGLIDWKILGIKFYTEVKEFEGKIELKK